MSLQMVNDETLASHIRKEGATLVEFGTKWCPPCKVLLPILDELSGEQGEKLRVLQVDCDDSPAAASRFGVMSTPTVILFVDGEPVEKLVGLRPKSSYELLLEKHAAR